jgi:hypothetical protein
MTFQIRDEFARDFSLYLKRITFEDAYNKTDSGFTGQKRKEQAYRFLEGVADVEKSLNEKICKQSQKKNAEQSQAHKR